MLTGDSLTGAPGVLDAEYILDGTQIKIGSGDAVKAASVVADDLVSITSHHEKRDLMYIN